MLDVGDGNAVYWEVCGNPDGKPAVVLHGGPGSGCTPWHRRWFDPDVYRIVLFDQRQCGRSTPHASKHDTDLRTNTTHHLLRDIEQLRSHLSIERWLVCGNSWGATLAQAYAQQHPERVSEIILLAVTTADHAGIDWLYHGAGRFFPEAWTAFREAIDGDDLVAAYHELLNDPDDAVRARAAERWCAWEDAVANLGRNARYDDPRFRMAFARIVTHYFHHDMWIEDGALLRDAHLLRDIPGVLIHGRLDIGGPLITAWELAQAWPDAELVVVDTDGHSGAEMMARLLDATEKLARS